MNDTHFLRVDIDASTQEITRPDASKVLSGDPIHTTWNLEERDGIYCGVWQSTPGKWRVIYDEWEYFRILSGVSIITQDGGRPVTMREGDSYVFRPGFKGTWEVIETTRKDYVIKL